MSSWNIAIVGANGQIGNALIELIQQNVSFKSLLSIDNIGLFGSDNSEGDVIRILGKNVTIENIEKANWDKYHIAFFAVNQNIAKKYATIVAQSGCVVIDASGAFALEDNIPLVLPKLNDNVLEDFRNENIISIASPIISQALCSIAALTDIQQLIQLRMVNLIPASFYGKQGVNELAGESARLLNGLPVESTLFDKQLAFNVLPINHSLTNGMVIVEQIKKITGNHQLSISSDSVLVPVFYGLTQSITFIPTVPFSIEHNIDESRFMQYGVNLKQYDYPTPVTEVNTEQDVIHQIHLGNIHYSYGEPEQISFFCVSDNIHYLGAQILLETAEKLLTDYLF